MEASSESSQSKSGARLVHIAPLISLFAVGILAARSIEDNSFLWHIRAGEVQFDQVGVLTSDVFSYTELGSTWRTQSWLPELLYFGLEWSFAGMSWVNWMLFIVASLITLFVSIAVYRVVQSPVVTALVVLVSVWLMAPFTQPRPVIFSYLLLAVLVVVLQNPKKTLWLIIPIIWIWAGVHGSWVIGGGLVALEWLRTRDSRLFTAGVLALGATLFTAHGIGTWQILVDFLGSRDALALMEEWKSPDFADFIQAPYFLLIAAIIVAAIRGKIAMKDLIVILPFMLFGMTSRRSVFPAAIVLIPWASMALPAMKSTAATLPRWIVGATGVMLALLAVTPLLLTPIGVLSADRFPSPEIVAAMPTGNAFHGDAEGGYLIYSVWPDRFVYIDDRAELYGAERLTEFNEARAGRYEETFDRYSIDVVLAHEDWTLTDILREDGWIVVAEDEPFVVFERS